MKIILVEDDVALRRELKTILKNNGYYVIAYDDFFNISSKIIEENADLILLDIGLPDSDGLSLCSEIRSKSIIPIIFLTSDSSSITEVTAFALGGDDYISKPYNVSVLLSHISAVLKRTSKNTDLLTYRGIELYLKKCKVCYEGLEEELTKTEQKILLFLFERPQIIVERSMLIDYLWENECYIDDNTLSVNITRLRKKLSNIGVENLIITKHKQGYMIWKLELKILF